MVIIMMSTRPHFMTFVSQEFFNYMFTENLAENCQHVVIRITNPAEEGNGQRRRRRSRSEGKVDPDTIMKTHGLEKEKIKAKLCKLMNVMVGVAHVRLIDIAMDSVAILNLRVCVCVPFCVSVCVCVCVCCLLYTSPSPRDATLSRMPSSA